MAGDAAEPAGQKRVREPEMAELRHYTSSKTTLLEKEFIESTSGLQSADEYRAKRQMLEKQVKGTMDGVPLSHLAAGPTKGGVVMKQKLAGQKQVTKLSFGDSDDENSEDSEPPVLKLSKNAEVDTSALPDKDKLEELRLLHIELTKKYQEQRQEQMESKIKVTFSYWDGAGHRDTVEVSQKDTIFDFIKAARTKLIMTTMPHVKKVRLENLIFVKEDVILSNDITFFELIEKKARGITGGSLHSFEVFDDLRINADVNTKGDRSHPGKIVTRSWYELNKHTFPASKWESFDPVKHFPITKKEEKKPERDY